MVYNRKKNNIWYIVILCSVLAACQKPPAVIENTAQKDNPTPQKQPQPLVFNAQIAPLNLSKSLCEERRCAEFSIAHLKSNYTFIDQTLAQATLDLLKQKLDLHFVNEVMSNNAHSNPPHDLSFNEQIQHYADTFFQLDQSLNQINSNLHASFVIQINQQTHQGDILTLVLKSHDFLGGAHASNSQRYFVFDLAQQQQVTLDDILLPHQKNVLKDIVYRQFKDWVLLEKLADDVGDYEQAWPFKLSQNFYLSEKGLVLQYNEYDIAPYAMGAPNFTILYADLKNILKPQFLMNHS